MQLCPNATLLQYVNPMAINTWALAKQFPALKQVGLCHSVQNTVQELAHDLDLPKGDIRYKVAGVNHVAFFLRLEHQGRDLYPALRQGYASGQLPKPPLLMPRCANKVRYEVMDHLGYFCTESSEHLAEYVPWFIKNGRDDLIEQFSIPLDEYPTRCEEQVASWKEQAKTLTDGRKIDVTRSHEFAADLMNAIVTDTPYVAYGNLPNTGQIPQLPLGAAVETPCLVDANGIQPSVVTDIPPQLVALMRTPDQRAGTDRARPDPANPRTYLPRRHDGPPHSGRTGFAPDPKPRHRPAECPFRLAARLVPPTPRRLIFIFSKILKNDPKPRAQNCPRPRKTR